ncbi:MAG: hypothetical protein ACTSQF_08170 [Candidatus Heimdallarchaeaceae archaeon]
MSETKNRRTMIERAKAIFALIEYLDEPFPKSQLQDIGLNPATADKWLNLIVYIQKQPRIRLVKSKRTTIIEKHEQRYHTMSREIFMDPNRSYEERFNALQNYLSALITSERLRDQVEIPASTTYYSNIEKKKEEKLKRLKELEK